jgi:hypothetical protein
MTNCTSAGSRFRIGVLALALLLPVFATRAQQDQPAAQQAPTQQEATPQQQQAAQSTPDKDKDKNSQKQNDQASGTSKDRLFFALPNFLSVENAANVPPLTTKQKFAVVTRSSFDYVEIPWYAALAAVSQAENSEPGYGQGWAGYGKRFGATAADGTIENYFTSAIMPSLLHQDPRFFQMGKGGFWHRAFYAMSRTVVTRSDAGNAQFNASEIFGSALAAGISTYSYHPHEDKTLSNTASVWGTQLAYDTITIVLKEFWPDIHRKFSHKNSTP